MPSFYRFNLAKYTTIALLFCSSKVAVADMSEDFRHAVSPHHNLFTKASTVSKLKRTSPTVSPTTSAAPSTSSAPSKSSMPSVTPTISLAPSASSVPSSLPSLSSVPSARPSIHLSKKGKSKSKSKSKSKCKASKTASSTQGTTLPKGKYGKSKANCDDTSSPPSESSTNTPSIMPTISPEPSESSVPSFSPSQSSTPSEGPSKKAKSKSKMSKSAKSKCKGSKALAKGKSGKGGANCEDQTPKPSNLPTATPTSSLNLKESPDLFSLMPSQSPMEVELPFEFITQAPSVMETETMLPSINIPPTQSPSENITDIGRGANATNTTDVTDAINTSVEDPKKFLDEVNASDVVLASASSGGSIADISGNEMVYGSIVVPGIVAIFAFAVVLVV